MNGGAKGRCRTSRAGRPVALFRWTSSMPANVSFMKSLQLHIGAFNECAIGCALQRASLSACAGVWIQEVRLTCPHMWCMYRQCSILGTLPPLQPVHCSFQMRSLPKQSPWQHRTCALSPLLWRCLRHAVPEALFFCSPIGCRGVVVLASAPVGCDCFRRGRTSAQNAMV
jgi:hypothetical protein